MDRLLSATSSGFGPSVHIKNVSFSPNSRNVSFSSSERNVSKQTTITDNINSPNNSATSENVSKKALERNVSKKTLERNVSLENRNVSGKKVFNSNSKSTMLEKNVFLGERSVFLGKGNVSGDGGAWKGYRDCVTGEAMMQNYGNFKKSGVPERMMMWREGAWVEIGKDALEWVKGAFLERRAMVEIEVEGNECVFDFYRMLVVEVANSGLQRSIAWIDVDGVCFFPKFFIDESLLDNDHDDCDGESCFEVPKIEIEVKVISSSSNNDDNNNRIRDDDEKLMSGKRKRSDQEDTADSSCNSGVGNGNSGEEDRVAKKSRLVGWPNSRVIGQEEKSYALVKDLFMKGMRMVDSRVEITGFHQFTRTGPLEKARLVAFHKLTEKTEAARGKSNTVFAWHGTSRKGVCNVFGRGFEYPSNVVESQAHGVGVYLSNARLPQLSDMLAEPDENGEKHVVFCRVILGNLEKVEAGSQQCYPSSMNFDNGVDDPLNPKWYVVWSTNMNTHIFPECVVSYKCSDRAQGGAMQGSDLLPWIPKGRKPESANLFFSRLTSWLPSDKVDQLKAICMAFKAGNMTKDLFIRQLRSVAGNEMLTSAINGIQGPN